MRALLLAFLLGACTVPPPMPVKAEEKAIVEVAPKPPPTPEKPKLTPKATVPKVPDPPGLPPCPELSAPIHPRQMILQKMDCVIRNNTKP
jgi:hypothetical protein